jgi:hypothetical protein
MEFWIAFGRMRERIAKKDPNLWVSLFLLIFSVGVAHEAYRLGLGDFHSPGPGFMFFGASCILGLLAIHLFFKSLLATERKGRESIWRGKRLGRVASFFVALAIYNFLLERLGYLLTTFFFLAFLFWVTREDSGRCGLDFLFVVPNILPPFYAHVPEGTN